MHDLAGLLIRPVRKQRSVTRPIQRRANIVGHAAVDMKVAYGRRWMRDEGRRCNTRRGSAFDTNNIAVVLRLSSRVRYRQLLSRHDLVERHSCARDDRTARL